MMESDDLKLILSEIGDEIVVMSGQIKGRTIKGVFDTNHFDRSLSGVPIATSGPIFTCHAHDIEGLKAGDVVEFRNIELQVSKVMKDATGLARIEFIEDLDGEGITHANL